jgi:hypothetical protein
MSQDIGDGALAVTSRLSARYELECGEDEDDEEEAEKA